MQNEVLDHVRETVKHWYLLLILGIIMIGVGIWVFLTPLEAYITLAMLFAFTFLIAGIMEIIYAVSSRKLLDNWGWTLAGGIIDLMIGVLLVTQPGISMIVLPFYVGFAIMFRSVMAIGWALELKRQYIKDWGNLLAIGIMGLIFSFVMIWNPLFAGMTLVFYTAMAFIIAGISQVYLSFSLKKFYKLLKGAGDQQNDAESREFTF